MTQKSAPIGISARVTIHGAQLLPAPLVHSDLTSLAPLAVANEQRPAPLVEIELRKA